MSSKTAAAQVGLASVPMAGWNCCLDVWSFLLSVSCLFMEEFSWICSIFDSTIIDNYSLVVSIELTYAAVESPISTHAQAFSALSG